MSAPDRGNSKRGFAILAGVNLGVAGCAVLRWPVMPDREVWPSVLLLFPFAQFAWSLPIILAAILRGRRETARGMACAIAATSVVGYGYWIWISHQFFGAFRT